MNTLDRRSLLKLAFGVAAVAAVGATVAPKIAEAAPLPAAPAGEPATTETLVEQAQYRRRWRRRYWRRRYWRRRRCRRVCWRGRYGRIRCRVRCW
ncbi:MAG: twin-arginine translocation signal domain-containing protein [Hyphomicrobiaceae bacterium]